MLTLFAAGEADAAEFKARIKQMHRAAVPEALSWAPVRMRSSQACGTDLVLRRWQTEGGWLLTWNSRRKRCWDMWM